VAAVDRADGAVDAQAEAHPHDRPAGSRAGLERQRVGELLDQLEAQAQPAAAVCTAPGGADALVGHGDAQHVAPDIRREPQLARPPPIRVEHDVRARLRQRLVDPPQGVVRGSTSGRQRPHGPAQRDDHLPARRNRHRQASGLHGIRQSLVS
jgi:putative intracellular protease/amidase